MLDIRNIEDLVFDGIQDTYALIDEVGNENTSKILKNGYFDALAWIDEGQLAFRLKHLGYSTILLEIYTGGAVSSWKTLAERVEWAREDLVDKGYARPGSIYFEKNPNSMIQAYIYIEQ